MDARAPSPMDMSLHIKLAGVYMHGLCAPLEQAIGLLRAVVVQTDAELARLGSLRTARPRAMDVVRSRRTAARTMLIKAQQPEP